MNKVATAAGTEVIHGLSNTFLLAKVIWLLPLLSVQSASNRDQPESPKWHYSLRRPTHHFMANKPHWAPSMLQDPVVHLPRERYLFGQWVYFLAHRISANITLCRDLENT